jgi:hypothetical protein
MICQYPGCRRLTTKDRCSEHRGTAARSRDAIPETVRQVCIAKSVENLTGAGQDADVVVNRKPLLPFARISAKLHFCPLGPQATLRLRAFWKPLCRRLVGS